MGLLKTRTADPSILPAAPATRRAIVPFSIVALLIGLHLYFGASFIRSSAATYDEPSHLASGYTYWKTGQYRLDYLGHPPLARLWDAVPLLWLRPNLYPQLPEWIEGRFFHYSDYFLYHNRIDHERMLNAARLFSLFSWTALLAFGVLAWAKRFAGDVGMVGAAAAYAFCPALLSNLSLVTTDGGSTVLFFLIFWILAEAERRSLLRWTAAGVFTGLAHAAKFNMILIGPLVLCIIVAERGFAVLSSSSGRRMNFFPGIPLAGLAVFFGAGFLTLAAAYRFGQFPLYWQGLYATLHGLGDGRSSFFFGHYSTKGFLMYFPAALAIKMPVATTILAVVGIVALRRVRRELLWLIVPPAAYLAAALTVKVQIGYRHVLPVVPFVIVWAACGTSWLWEQKWGKPVLAFLSIWLAISVWRVQPYDLAYFNELAGGSSRGYEYLIDSNLDWGQGLKDLAAETKAMGNPPVYLSYFGAADPAAYGLHYAPVGFVSNVDRIGDIPDPSVSGKVLFAVSATNFQCTYYPNKSMFDWLKKRRPLRVIDYSIFLYDLTGDAEAYENLANLLELSGQPVAARGLLAKLQKLKMLTFH